MTSVAEIVQRLETYIINPALLLIFTAGFFLFIWGLVMFLINIEEKDKRNTGKDHMVWGLVGMFVMVGVYGILALISNTFDLGVDPRNPQSFNPDMSRIERITKPLFEKSLR
ncbi:MAG TPA: hypothetical protein VJH69_00955 [Candidatus Paceibacterota bacterium]